MKIGLKLWSINHNLLPEAVKLIDSGVFDYVELMPVPNTKPDIFKDYAIPYIIHGISERFGFNLGDSSLYRNNLDILFENIRWADSLNASYIILHPGYGNIDVAIELLDEVFDHRILIENFPKVGVNNEDLFGYTPQHLQLLLKNKFGLCLDFGHAIKAALSLNLDYKRFILDLMQLEPIMFHISDGTFRSERDEHLPLLKGEYDLKWLVDQANNSNGLYMTLETPRDNLNSLHEDIRNVGILYRLLNNS